MVSARFVNEKWHQKRPEVKLQWYHSRPDVLAVTGSLRNHYLKEQHPLLCSELLLSGELYSHLLEIDEACEERMNLLTRQMATQEGVTEALKAADQMEWVRRMNSIRNRAEEIVLHELIYC